MTRCRDLLLGAFVFALWTAPAGATPPDQLDTTALPLCTAGDGLILLVQSRNNAGTYYVADDRVDLVRFDARDGSLQVESLGGASANWVNSEEPHDPYETHSVSGTTGAGDALARWGASRCGPLTGPAMNTLVASHLGISVRLVDGALELQRDGRSRRVPITAATSLQFLAGHWHDPPMEPGPLPMAEDLDTYEASLTIGSPWQLESTVAIPVRIEGEFGRYDGLLGVESKTWRGARSWLANAEGLDEHRAERFDESARWFEVAALIDPENEIARWNHACALSRLGRTDAALDRLEDLEPTKKLRDKATTDADLDPLRSNRRFQIWLGGLPRK